MSDGMRDFGWDEEVLVGEGGNYILLPEGDYNFTVESFERGRYNGSDKVPPCNKATLKLRIESEEGTTLITESLLLYERMQWKLADFFLSIGEKEVDGKVRMNWANVTGATGRATLEITKDKNDETKQYNHVKKFLPKQAKTFKAGDF